MPTIFFWLCFRPGRHSGKGTGLPLAFVCSGGQTKQCRLDGSEDRRGYGSSGGWNLRPLYGLGGGMSRASPGAGGCWLLVFLDLQPPTQPSPPHGLLPLCVSMSKIPLLTSTLSCGTWALPPTHTPE